MIDEKRTPEGDPMSAEEVAKGLQERVESIERDCIGKVIDLPDGKKDYLPFETERCRREVLAAYANALKRYGNTRLEEAEKVCRQVTQDHLPLLCTDAEVQDMEVSTWLSEKCAQRIQALKEDV